MQLVCGNDYFDNISSELFIKKGFQRKKNLFLNLKGLPARQDLGVLLDMPYLEHKEIYLNNL
jgi:hypothetical protein